MPGLSTEPEGFAAALEAAATGRPPGSVVPDQVPSHSAQEARVFTELVEYYGRKRDTDDFETVHDVLQPVVARVIADYPEDVHDIMRNPGMGVDARHIEDTDELTREMHRTIARVSDDPRAHDIIRTSQLAEGARRMAGFEMGDFASESSVAHASRTMRGAADVMGQLDGIII